MFVYTNRGRKDYEAVPVPSHRRGVWEFWGLLSGTVGMQPEGMTAPVSITMPTFFLFPPDHTHGWIGGADTERVVFHFSTLPSECTDLLPLRGYFRVSLAERDCTRLRELGKSAEQTIKGGTQIAAIEEQCLLYELCLLALRETPVGSVDVEEKAKKIVELALLRYSAALPERLTLLELSKSLHTSPAQLRRYFHKILGEGPRSAFGRIRLRKAEELLATTDLTVECISQQVGFATSSALINAMKRELGSSPTELRTKRRAAPDIAKSVNRPHPKRVSDGSVQCSVFSVQARLGP